LDGVRDPLVFAIHRCRRVSTESEEDGSKAEIAAAGGLARYILEYQDHVITLSGTEK
jgi:hypothetical protein